MASNEHRTFGDISAGLDARVLIIEGISGSGKDTFQDYLKEQLKDRPVNDYSEGELLHSWKHFPIKGILNLRINFLKLFIDHVKNTVGCDESAVFLLNRFHLSTYVTTVMRQPELEGKYNAIVDVLRTLPAHVFILQLDENDIAQRSAHSERAGAWNKVRQQMAETDGFRGTVERYILQQRIMLETAKKQKIPYSLVKGAYAPPRVEILPSPALPDDKTEEGNASH